jgi:hypothetical protein
MHRPRFHGICHSNCTKDSLFLGSGFPGSESMNSHLNLVLRTHNFWHLAAQAHSSMFFNASLITNLLFLGSGCPNSESLNSDLHPTHPLWAPAAQAQIPSSESQNDHLNLLSSLGLGCTNISFMVFVIRTLLRTHNFWVLAFLARNLWILT